MPHQLINTGNKTLRYLVMDRKETTSADVVVYPDSKKTGCIAYSANGPRVAFFRDKDSKGF
eukprot:UN02262